MSVSNELANNSLDGFFSDLRVLLPHICDEQDLDTIATLLLEYRDDVLKEAADFVESISEEARNEIYDLIRDEEE